MSINESKLNELEAKINNFENILKDMRDELKSQIEGNDIETDADAKESKLTFTQRMKIQDIMEDFNFQKVHDVMVQLDWKWAMTKYGTPTVDELKREAKDLLIEACIERNCISTGGFRAVYEEGTPGDPDPFIGLEFIIEECEGFVEDDGDDELDAKDED